MCLTQHCRGQSSRCCCVSALYFLESTCQSTLNAVWRFGPRRWCHNLIWIQISVQTSQTAVKLLVWERLISQADDNHQFYQMQLFNCLIGQVVWWMCSVCWPFRLNQRTYTLEGCEINGSWNKKMEKIWLLVKLHLYFSCYATSYQYTVSFCCWKTMKRQLCVLF